MTLRIVRKKARASIVDFAEIAFAASVFVNHAFNDRRARGIISRCRDG